VTAGVSTDRPGRRVQRSILGTGAFWLLGSVVVALAQPSTDRALAAAGAAMAGIATILVVRRLTPDPGRRYFRSLLGAMVAVSVVGDWLVQRLNGDANGFIQYGLDTRIALPLIFVLLLPLVLLAMPTRLRSRALWRDRALVWREASALDWLTAAYALLIVPALLLGLAHHAPKSYIAQDLGLIVFFVFAYVAGRTISAEAARAGAIELVGVLLVLAGAQALFGWDTTPIFTYVDAACAGAVAFAVLRPTKTRLVMGGLALVLLGRGAIAVKHGSGSTTAVELAAALGIIVYLVVRARRLVPQWLVIAIAAAALVGFLAFNADGATVRGQYHGTDESNLGRTYEAHQVREAIHSSPVSLVLGRGLGGTVDETQAPPLFAASLVYGGRDLAHVQEVHLLPYGFLLKHGLLGFAWLAAFVVGVAILGIRALETATKHRDPTPVVYAALPLLGIATALAAATHLQDNPLNALAVGVLVTRFGGEAIPRPRLGVAVPAAAVIFAAVGAIAFSGRVGPFVFPGYGGDQGGVNATVVGDVRFNYPFGFHLRHFATTNPRITGVHGVRVRGVVVASYRLKRHPELGGSGERLRPDGVFFELYQAPLLGHRLAPARTFPLTIFDLSTIRSLTDTATTEQGGVRFSVKGRNYRTILWVGAHAPKSALFVADNLVNSLQVNQVRAAPHARERPGTPARKRR
jgi:hypothetical protein